MKKQVHVHACIIYMPCPTCPSTFTSSTCLICWLCSFTCITCYFACFTCLFTCFACSFTCSTCSFAWSNMFDMVFYMFIHGWHVLWHVPACTWYSMDIILLISTQRILKIGSSRLRHANMTCIHCKHNIYMNMNMNMTRYMHVTYTLADHGHNASYATTCWNEGPRLNHCYQGLLQDM